jgi:hypothetical protein
LCQFTIKVTKLNYREISLLSTSYKIVSNIPPSRSSTYIDEITGNHQCGCQRNRSTTELSSKFRIAKFMYIH